jgi:hypothetical protein
MIKESEHKGAEDNRERIIFNSIRKPLAPPGRAFENSLPNSRARPAGRKAKHKKQITTEDDF